MGGACSTHGEKVKYAHNIGLNRDTNRAFL
jgi:hypothetical protein